MGQRPGFKVTRHAPAFPGSGRANEITVEIRVFAPYNTSRARVVALMEETVGQAGESAVWTWAEEVLTDGAGDSGVGPGTPDA